MAQDTNQVRTGVTGRILVAPALSAGPASTAAAWPGTWVDLGLCSPDGPSVQPKPTTKDFFAWQQLLPIKTIQTAWTMDVKFKLMQTTGTALKLAFGGGTISNIGGGDYQYTPPAIGVVDERSIGIEVVDGSIILRKVIQRCIVTAIDPIAYKRDELVMYSLTASVLGVTSGSIWTDISNDASFAA